MLARQIGNKLECAFDNIVVRQHLQCFLGDLEEPHVHELFALPTLIEAEVGECPQ